MQCVLSQNVSNLTNQEDKVISSGWPLYSICLVQNKTIRTWH